MAVISGWFRPVPDDGCLFRFDQVEAVALADDQFAVTQEWEEVLADGSVVLTPVTVIVTPLLHVGRRVGYCTKADEDADRGGVRGVVDRLYADRCVVRLDSGELLDLCQIDVVEMWS